MPVIRVEMFKRTQEQKRDLARELTEAFIRTCGGNKDAIEFLLLKSMKVIGLQVVLSQQIRKIK